jgi:hypothetical protein
MYALMELPKALTFLPKALSSSLFVCLPSNSLLSQKLFTGHYSAESINHTYNSATLTYTNFSVNSPMSFADNSTS